MFSRQAIRLLRTTWGDNTDLLAKELFAMFSEVDLPLFHSGPITLEANGEEAPITIRNFSDGDVVFNIRGRTGDKFVDIIIEDDTLGFRPAGEDRLPRVVRVTPTSTSTFAGKVLSGSGDTYVMHVYEQGRSRDPVMRTVKQLQIDAAETIPADTWALVAKQPDGEYLMQVPIWLE